MAQERERKEPAAVYPRMGEPGAVYIGLPHDSWSDAYHRLLTVPLWMFLGAMAAGYLVINLAFAGLFLFDPTGIGGARRGSFLDDFFFSAQTLGSVGYGAMWPKSVYANSIAMVEMFLGLLNLGVATGLLFARISRPTARIMFSERAVVTTHDGVPTLMFRAANRRRNLVVEAEVSVTLIHDVRTLEGGMLRRFDELVLEHSRTPLFFLTWQVMHPIVEGSPLFGETTESLLAKSAEILVVMKGLDETFVSTIHARSSYRPEEIAWGRRLADIFSTGPDGGRTIDFRRFHEIV